MKILKSKKLELAIYHNEPKAQPFGGYLCKAKPDGYPPFEHDAKKAAQVAYHFGLITALCVKAYHEGNYDGEIGLIED